MQPQTIYLTLHCRFQTIPLPRLSPYVVSTGITYLLNRIFVTGDHSAPSIDPFLCRYFRNSTFSTFLTSNFRNRRIFGCFSCRKLEIINQTPSDSSCTWIPITCIECAMRWVVYLDLLSLRASCSDHFAAFYLIEQVGLRICTANFEIFSFLA